jgi:hypothetical protein
MLTCGTPARPTPLLKAVAVLVVFVDGLPGGGDRVPDGELGARDGGDPRGSDFALQLARILGARVFATTAAGQLANNTLRYRWFA